MKLQEIHGTHRKFTGRWLILKEVIGNTKRREAVA